MDKPRALPPLVRGKVIGVFNFYIDEIVISKNLFFLANNYDITAQVQWWGEILPAFIRPKTLQLQGKISCNCQSSKAYFHLAQYEIKTTVGLFKSYLRACEVVELSVYDGFESSVIGSAFLKNLGNLLSRNNEFIFLPIIDYSGEEIGQIKMHIDFIEYFQDINTENHSTCKKLTYGTNSGTLRKKISELLKCHVCPTEKTIFYDGCSKLTNVEVKSAQHSEFDKHLERDKSRQPDLVLTNYESEVGSKSYFTNESKESTKFINLPVVCLSKDSSKTLNFDLKTNKPKRNNESKLSLKCYSNSVRCKSKSKNEKSSVGMRVSGKATLRNQVLEKPKMTINNQVDLEVPFIKGPKESFNNKSAGLESTVQTSGNNMVFDYLLGSDMSKENEESALKDFKEMSPSHDIVCSINKLCLNLEKPKIFDNKSIKPSLYFDLTNPIERNYYEKFFVNSNSNDFEIAELLNEHESSSTLQTWKSNDENIQEYCFKFENTSVDETITNKYEDFPSDFINKANKLKNNCARCKYYKKLDELDTIIESLKYFEKNMLKEEKLLQLNFDDDLNQQDHKVSDR